MSLASAPLAHHLPWYFGLAMALLWAAVLLAAGLLGYRRWQGRLLRRRRPKVVPDDRSLGPGNDLEVW